MLELLESDMSLKGASDLAGECAVSAGGELLELLAQLGETTACATFVGMA